MASWMADSIPPKMMSLEMFFSRCIASPRERTACRWAWRACSLSTAASFLFFLVLVVVLAIARNPVGVGQIGRPSYVSIDPVSRSLVEPVEPVGPEADADPGVQRTVVESANLAMRSGNGD